LPRWLPCLFESVLLSFGNRISRRATCLDANYSVFLPRASEIHRATRAFFFSCMNFFSFFPRGATTSRPRPPCFKLRLSRTRILPRPQLVFLPPSVFLVRRSCLLCMSICDSDAGGLLPMSVDSRRLRFLPLTCGTGCHDLRFPFFFLSRARGFQELRLHSFLRDTPVEIPSYLFQPSPAAQRFCPLDTPLFFDSVNLSLRTRPVG